MRRRRRIVLQLFVILLQRSIVKSMHISRKWYSNNYFPTNSENQTTWLLFNPCKDIRDAFWNKQEHGLNPVQLRQDFFFSTVSWFLNLPPPCEIRPQLYSSDCSHPHDQLSCAIAGLAASLWLPQVAEEVEDVVWTVLVWHCVAAVGVHLRPESTCGRHHSCRSGAGGRGGYDHQWGGGSGHSYPSLIALTGLRQSPVHSGVLQVITVHRLIIVQDLPLLVHSLPTMEDTKHRRSLVDN